MGSLLAPLSSGTGYREKVNPASISYSSYGTTIVEAPLYELKHLWPIQVRLNATDSLTLERIFHEWDATKTAITVQDYLRPFTENSPRTRAIATGASEVTANGKVSYFARFKAHFSGEPRWSNSGRFKLCQFELEEDAATTA